MKSLAPVDRRLRGYFRTVLHRRHGIPYVIDFDFLAESLKMARRSIERGVAKLRADGAFNFLTIRVGRSFAVKVSDRHRSIRGVFPLRREKIETPNRSSGAPCAPKETAREDADSSPPSPASAPDSYEPQQRKIAALAACLARGELADQHWDNCKITWRFAHAFRFARQSLSSGHSVNALVRAYDFAVHERHKDATDYALNHSCEPSRWEPSSTITLAAEKLRQDGRTVGQRWREFFRQPRRDKGNKMLTSTITSTPAPRADRPREEPVAAPASEPTPAQFLRFLERKGITPAEFMGFSYQMRSGYLEQARLFFSSNPQATK